MTRKRFRHQRFDRGKRHRSSQELSHRSHTHPRKTAGYNRRKIREVGINVQRKTVVRHPTANPDPDGSNFLFPHPDPREPVSPVRLKTKLLESFNEYRLQSPEVPVHVAAVMSKINDRVSHELPRSVERHIPPPANPIDRDRARGQEMLGVSPPPKREHRGMFKEKKAIVALTLIPLSDQRFLPG